MMDDWNSALGVGLQSHDIGIAQMALRGIIIYVATLAIVRAGKKRFLGRASAFDTIVGIMIGSIVSRAITGGAPLLPSIAASAAIVALHWLLSWAAVRWDWFGGLIKGRPVLVVRDGRPDERRLRGEHMSDRDLDEDLRGRGLAGTDTIAEARLERSGQLSVLKKPSAPKMIEVEVAQGVQTVRIEIA